VGRASAACLRRRAQSADVYLNVLLNQRNNALQDKNYAVFVQQLVRGATMKAGITEQSNFDTYRLVRMPDAPRALHVELLDTDAPPGGIGEPGVPPVAPPIANAIFVLTGRRIRTLPLMLAGIV
jgi:hypothetical protein